MPHAYPGHFVPPCAPGVPLSPCVSGDPFPQCRSVRPFVPRVCRTVRGHFVPPFVSESLYCPVCVRNPLSPVRACGSGTILCPRVYPQIRVLFGREDGGTCPRHCSLLCHWESTKVHRLCRGSFVPPSGSVCPRVVRPNTGDSEVSRVRIHAGCWRWWRRWRRQTQTGCC